MKLFLWAVRLWYNIEKLSNHYEVIKLIENFSLIQLPAWIFRCLQNWLRLHSKHSNDKSINGKILMSWGFLVSIIKLGRHFDSAVLRYTSFSTCACFSMCMFQLTMADSQCFIKLILVIIIHHDSVVSSTKVGNYWLLRCKAVCMQSTQTWLCLHQEAYRIHRVDVVTRSSANNE